MLCRRVWVSDFRGKLKRREVGWCKQGKVRTLVSWKAHSLPM